ncbi:MAG: hypothetical protein ACRDXB_14040, partial [Actinomycetes bacterium]
MSSAIKRLLSIIACTAVCVAGQMIVAPGPASAGQVGVTIRVQGSGSVQVVEGSLEDGGSTICNWTANKDERVINTCARIRNEETFEAWVWLRATPGNSPAGHWRFAEWTGCDETRVVGGHTECAVHSGVFDSVERAPVARFADDVAPTVSGVTATISAFVERNAFYTFSSNEGQLQCRFEAQAFFTNCASGIGRTYPTEGLKTIDVRAVDESGQIGASIS